jgi:hypothetical protein
VTTTITVEERRARLARRHLLLPEHRTDDVAAIADAVVALHSSDPVTVYLSAAARMRTPSFETVEAALYDQRAVVRHHAMRRTLWVATPDVARAMHAAATRRLVGPEERRTLKLLADNGIDDPVAWLADARAQALAALHEHGPMNARQLGERVPALRHPIQMAPGKSYGGVAAAHTRVLLSLGFEGEVLRTRPSGTWVNGAYTYAATDTWLEGGLGDLKEDEAAATLAHRWLTRFGPATSVDLQWWMGWTVALTRQALADSGATPVELEQQAGTAVPGWVARDDEPTEQVGPWVAVLPSLDPTTMGWKLRDWYLDPACAGAFDRNGNAGPTIWVDGRVVGAWAQTKGGELRSHYFLDTTARQRRAVDDELARLRDLVGETRFSFRFPGLIQKSLLA